MSHFDFESASIDFAVDVLRDTCEKLTHWPVQWLSIDLVDFFDNVRWFLGVASAGTWNFDSILPRYPGARTPKQPDDCQKLPPCTNRRSGFSYLFLNKSLGEKSTKWLLAKIFCSFCYNIGFAAQKQSTLTNLPTCWQLCQGFFCVVYLSNLLNWTTASDLISSSTRSHPGVVCYPKPKNSNNRCWSVSWKIRLITKTRGI